MTISEEATLAARCYLWSLPPWFTALVMNALEIISQVFSVIYSVNSASISLLALQWRRGGTLSANKGFLNPAIVTKFSPLAEQNDDLQFCPLGYLSTKGVHGEGDVGRRPSQSILHRERDMRRPIPYRTRRMVAPPASGRSCRPTSLQ